ncbi:unnamed protein product [Haemonchus placei]|uniref:Uncharacterized protein n=1 Tax=Haemonchus placei TaxID=6290 RepID=A0A0N4WTQ8_HAEPC|nr:unnamed protein product [Haemonchus placei]
MQELVLPSSRRTSAPALPAIKLISTAISRYAVLRASIRSTDSDIMLAPLQTLLLTPLQPSGINILDIALLYIEQLPAASPVAKDTSAFVARIWER